MKVLLAATVCEKGDLQGNLARHRAVLEEAAATGVELAVFPEMSLTGSVDPIRHPEHAVPAGHVAVQQLATAAERFGVQAVVGIGERDGEDLYISQLHLRGGGVAFSASGTSERGRRASPGPTTRSASPWAACPSGS